MSFRLVNGRGFEGAGAGSAGGEGVRDREEEERRKFGGL